MHQGQINVAFGDAKTVLPEGLVHPPHWLKQEGS
jgi:prepilin-type processing-associated H-X9-DG protein